MTIDEGTFEPWDTDMETVNPIDFDGYPEKIEALRKELKIDEAVCTGRGKIYGLDTVIAVMDSRFMMGNEMKPWNCRRGMVSLSPPAIFTVQRG